jgi:pyruvate-formate lyase
MLVGAVIGGLISWLVYTRQQKIAKIQDVALERIEELNKRHDKILKTIEAIEEHNKKTLDSVLSLEERLAAQSESRK